MARNDMKLLEAGGINASYGDVQVLWSVSIDVAEGEIVALLGSNGAGKTTFLRTISRIVKSSSGTIKWMGQEIQGDQPHQVARRGISHVPEGRELFAELSVYDNLMLGGMYVQKDPARKAALLAQVYELFPRLKERASQISGSLSGGEQQMLAIGRGLMSDPRLLMLDEPSLGLAPIVVSEMFAAIREINRRGVTVLLVEQNVNQTLEICSRAYILEAGVISREGKGADLLGDDQIRKAYLGL